MRKLLISFLLGIVACMGVVLGTILFETSNRPQYKAYAEIKWDPNIITVTVEIQAVKDRFDLKDCAGVVKFYSDPDKTFLEQKEWHTVSGATQTSFTLPRYYFGQDANLPYAVAEITEVTNVHGRGKEIWGILLWALGGVSQVGCLVLLGLAVWKKDKAAPGLARDAASQDEEKRPEDAP